MKNLTIIIISIIILSGCNSDKKKTSSQLEFFPLKWATLNEYSDILEGLKIDESILVNNPPKDKSQLIKTILKYREEKGMKIDPSCLLYTLTFYNYTSSSSVYLEQNYRDDINGVRYRLYDDSKYEIATIFIDPCKTDSSKWEISVNIYYNYIEDYGSYSIYRKIIDSCATMVDNKFVIKQDTGMEKESLDHIEDSNSYLDTMME